MDQGSLPLGRAKKTGLLNKFVCFPFSSKGEKRILFLSGG